MKNLIVALLFAPSIFGAQPTLGGGETIAANRLTLQIYDYAEAPAAVLEKAQKHADAIFGRIGLELDWIESSIAPDPVAARAVGKPLGPNQLVLRLLPASMSKQYGLPPNVFGFAAPTASGRPGAFINLFYGHVEGLATTGEIGANERNAQAMILGYMMAHEIGHLLLGPGSHSPTGIMKFPWDKASVREMQRGRMRFAADEVSRLRREVARRAALIQLRSDGDQ